MTKRTSKSQKGGISITKRGAVLEDIKKNRLDKFEEHLRAVETTNFDNNKAMWLAIEMSRPEHFKIIGSMGGVHIEATLKNKDKEETILQYALRVSDFETIKTVLDYDNQRGFKIDQINAYELILAINHSESMKVLEYMFNLPGLVKTDIQNKFYIKSKKYIFHDPNNKALIEALNKNHEVAKLIIENTRRDHISLNKDIYKLVNIFKEKNDTNYNKLFRELVIGTAGRPKLAVNSIIGSNANEKTIIFELLDHHQLLEIILMDGQANPNVREGGVGNTPLHYAVELYNTNQGAAKPLLHLLKISGVIPIPNLKTGKTPLDMLNNNLLEAFIKDDKQDFK